MKSFELLDRCAYVTMDGEGSSHDTLPEEIPHVSHTPLIGLSVYCLPSLYGCHLRSEH
jgi:hypothetical protein